MTRRIQRVFLVPACREYVSAVAVDQVIFLKKMFMTNKAKNKTNPLLKLFEAPLGNPPFPDIKEEHYLPAFKKAIKEGLREIDNIVNNPEAPDFGNTVAAFSFCGRLLDQVSQVFFNINGAETNPRIQDIARKVSPLLSDYENDILFNEKLFERVNQVYHQRENLNLETEQKTLLDKTWKMFVRNGAGLEVEKKERLRGISRDLSDLSLRFQDNLLAETNGYTLHITKEKDLSGLPDSAVEAAARLARDKGKKGWMFSLQAPSFLPFMQYADNRALREEIYMAFNTRCYKGNEYDNRDIVVKIANLRLERARLLGYSTHAHFVLEERMAEKPGKVNAFLHELLEAARPAALKELEDAQELAEKTGADFSLQPWDWAYYSEKLRKQRFDLDQEQLRPYFQLEKVKEGIFELTRRLWGLKYEPTSKVQVYHPEVETYQVFDEDERFLGLLYLDFFPREGKNSGAWMSTFRDQEKRNGSDIRPQVLVVGNFSRPSDTRPSLLTFNEFTTFVHEFGHALHGLLSDVTYPDLSGTSVYRDFVELPSQLMENWAFEPGFLNLFAEHYQSREKIPEEMVEKIIRAKNFNAGYATLRQLGFGLNDMAWHTLSQPTNEDPEKFEARAMKPAALLPRINNTMMSASFAHIFAGGYAAGYYGYKWAEVLDADTFQAFKEKGIFDRETARAFCEHILSKGGSEHPMTLYKRFRGKEPSIEPLLEREGLK